ncbi:MAG: hypothetical protein KBD01_10495 [Acidobacteria bacterium]|nr:hypothetical protein [Acidobacteriota bacterium]
MTRGRPGWSRALARWAVLLGAALPAVGQSLDGYVEVQATHGDETTTAEGDRPQESDFDTLVERLSATYLQPLWPNLQLSFGGFFERTASDGTIAGQDFDSTLTRQRPFASLRLRTPTLRGEALVERFETRSDANRVTRDTFSLVGGWFPNNTDYAQLRWFQSDEADRGREDLDRRQDSLSLTAQYRPTDWLGLQYRGALDGDENRLEETKVETESHNVRVMFDRSFWDRRWVVASDYNVNIRDVEVTAPPGAEVELPLAAVQGLSAIDDTPDEGVLEANPALIDGNLAVSSGINLGLPPAGGEDRPRNFGLDFGLPTDVDRLRVTIDDLGGRDLPPQIADSFSWDVWVSDDNFRWRRHQRLGSAPFRDIDRRWELDFETVETRYIKVVVRPLAPGVRDATQFPEIFVTEVQGLRRARVEQPDRRTTELFTFNSRLRLLDVPSLYYELNYLLNRADDSPDRTTLSNGLALSHAFARIWALSARLARETGEERDEDRTADYYSASLSAAPLDTLRSSVLVSGRRERFGETRQNIDTVLYNATAALYRGIDLNVNLGKSFLRDETDRRTETDIANVSASFVPNRYGSLTLTYQDDSRTSTGGGRRTEKDPNRSIELSATFSPFSTLYVFASHRVEDRADFDRRTLRSYNVSWSPFPYGRLRFHFYYDQTFDSELDVVTTLWGPGIRWNVTPRAYLDFSYQDTAQDSNLSDLDRGVYSLVARVAF